MTESTAVRSPTPELVAKAFLRPANHGQSSTLDQLPGAQRFWIDAENGRIAAAASGRGPAVLLLHGWEGQASDLMAFAPPLLAAGLRVVAIDLPAHGDSDGKTTSIPACALALLDVGRAIGPLHAVIGHSVGTAVAVEAMSHGLEVERAALISAPARYVDYARAFAAQAGLDRAQMQRMIEALLEIGVDVRAVSTPERTRHLHQPVLLVHSNDDRVVPVNDAVETASLWPGARLMRVDGLGHRRLLQDKPVIEVVTEFIQGATS